MKRDPYRHVKVLARLYLDVLDDLGLMAMDIDGVQRLLDALEQARESACTLAEQEAALADISNEKQA